MTYANGTATRKCIINHNNKVATSRESECASASSSSSTDLDSSSESDVLEQSSFVEPYTNESLASSSDEFEQTETDDEDIIFHHRHLCSDTGRKFRLNQDKSREVKMSKYIQ